MTYRSIVMGAAGRDFHDFRTFFTSHPDFHVCAFTAAQIPFIANRSFPRSLAGPSYEDDIPIRPETELPDLIARHRIEFVFFAYSDVSYQELMHKQSLVQAAGASFILLGPEHTELLTKRPVVAVTAVRTGAGKSPITQHLGRELARAGIRVAVLRHPMPYGDLERQAVERFESVSDLDRYDCTIEEREEYAPYLEQGLRVFAGVDYAAILRAAESESDAILWDGGNNDLPFVRPGLSIVIADALRPGHEIEYYPGETNLRRADIVVVNKVGTARPEHVALVRRNVADRNSRALLVEGDLAIAVDNGGAIRDRRVLVVEDGPTLTHGGMAFGAGTIAARQYGAAELVDPRPFARGSIADTFAAYPHIGAVLPAMGYSAEQRAELAATIEASLAELVVDASPAHVAPLLELEIPAVRVGYAFRQLSGPPLEHVVLDFLKRRAS